MQISTEMLVLVVLLALIVVAMVAVFAGRLSRQRRQAELKRAFGSEYERMVEQKQGSVTQAEQELRARKKRMEAQRLHALSATDRAQFAAEWSKVQARFVDDPAGAVQAADDLIKTVMVARGYTSDRFDQRVADLSVGHGDVVQHYREAHALAEANREGRADTEDLRQAVVHYRALFADLLEEQPQMPQRQPQEAHA